MRIICLSILVLLQSVLNAGIKIPKGTYKHDQLADAKAEAEEEGKALVFLYTDPSTN